MISIIIYTNFCFYLLFVYFYTENIPDIPLPTFQPRDQYVNLGESARFYCEAFVGKIELPDIKNDIYWYQVFDDHNEREIDGEQEIIAR